MIVPALLVNNKEEFIKRLKQIEPYVDMAQIDVMDGTLVPETSFWDPVEIINIKTSIDYEIHLMVEKPIAIINKYKEHQNVKRVYTHIECSEDPKEIIEVARVHGLEIGLAINPETPTSKIEQYIHEIDSVLFMGVNPGASGREFQKSVIEKIRVFHEAYQKIEIAVDGGVSSDTIGDLAKAGANRFAVGSAIFTHEKGPEAAIKKLKALL